MTLRPKGAARGGLWEFPGGKVEAGEGDAEALARELREELDLGVTVGRLLTTVRHGYSDLTVSLRLYLCQAHGEPRLIEAEAARWLTPAEALALPVAPADVPLVEALHREGVPRWEAPRVTVTLQPMSAADAPTLDRLVQLYAYDFSEALPIALGDDGRFPVPDLSAFFREPDHPFFIRADGALVGFALVARGSRLGSGEDVWDVAEFFVARRHRRAGVGRLAAHAVWRALPGPWEVRVRAGNASAAAFWARAIEALVGQPVAPEAREAFGAAWLRFAFTSPRG